ncbi:hypothetical protein EYF80_031255 [Liparis tanakae]|uniref:Uncharacterized protein n=1 Tax=Liparis tanakae TaxID=230148 RepID=A0A4Z2H0F2_9TELE|nr:hypothetical protein EYF80_031255 [Liparis tanakae]
METAKGGVNESVRAHIRARNRSVVSAPRGADGAQLYSVCCCIDEEEEEEEEREEEEQGASIRSGHRSAMIDPRLIPERLHEDDNQ